MPRVGESPAATALEIKREVEERIFQADQARARREQEYKLAKLELGVSTRHKAFVQIAIALVKAPALMVLCILLPVLVLNDKDLPPALVDFLSL